MLEKHHLVRGGPVSTNVAVFDTWPMDDLIDDAHRRIPDNPRIEALANNLIVDRTVAGRINDFVTWKPWIRSCHRHGAVFDQAYSLVDHGPFVAEIINKIAPRATISLYRVCDDYGVSDVKALFKAVNQAVAAQGPGQPLVLNLSLGVGPALELLDDVLNPFNVKDSRGNSLLLPDGSPIIFDMVEWAKYAAESVGRSLPTAQARELREHHTMAAVRHVFFGGDAHAGRQARNPGFANLLATALATVMHVFSGRKAHGARQPKEPTIPNILAVAAAGNENVPGQPEARRPKPLFPANVEGVIGVDARRKNQLRNKTNFTNLEDIPGTEDDGIGAVGDQIVGIFLSETVPGYKNYSAAPLNPQTNNTGWATWAGTSFSTPIVSAVAALLFEAGVSRDDAFRCIIDLKPKIRRDCIELEQT
jgi:Subtilase family